MFRKFLVPLSGLLIFLIASALPGQTPAPAPTTQPPAPGLRKLTGEDEKRAKQLEEQIDQASKEDRWNEVIARTEELLALRARVQGPKHFETVDVEWYLQAFRRVAQMPKEDRIAYQSAETMTEQAKKLLAQGQYAQAQPLCEKVLAIRRRLLTDDHPLTASGYNTLSYSLHVQHKYAQAQALLEKALDIHRRVLGENHPETATSYHNLAYNLDDQGKYLQAQPLLEKALEIRRRIFTDDDVITAESYSSLAFNLNGQGKPAAAQPLYEKALEIHRRTLTDNHPKTAQNYNNLAAILDAQGKYVAAQGLHEKALDIRRRIFTDDHLGTAESYSNLAYNLHSQGKYAAAQPFYEKALEIRRRRLTAADPLIALSYNNLAANLHAQGSHALAQALQEKALEIYHQVLTDDHPETAVAYGNLAGHLYAQGKYAEAQALAAKALEIHRRLLTDDHPFTATSYTNLAGTLNSQGKYPQAQVLFEKALEIRRRLFREDHPDTASSYQKLAANLDAQGKYAEAQLFGEKSLAIGRRLLGDDHPETTLSLDTLAGNLNAQGKYTEALALWLRAVKSLDAVRLRVAFTGLERAMTSIAVRPSLAAVQARLGRPAEAWQVLEEDLGRGLLDDLAARQDRRLTLQERDRLRQLLAELERLDRLFEAPMDKIDQAERRKRFDDLRSQRDRAQIALDELRVQLMKEYGPLAGRVTALPEIQSALPADAALVAWVDLKPVGTHAADPNGEHWGVVVRAKGTPVWTRIRGAGKDLRWTVADTELTARVRDALAVRPGLGTADLSPLLERVHMQRLAPLAAALQPTADGLPAVRRLIILPSAAMAGIPVEAILQSGDSWTVSYAPSATVLTYLRKQPHINAQAGLLALGDPAFAPAEPSIDPGPLPDHGLLLTVVVPASNAARHGLKPGDVLLAYNGTDLRKREDLKAVAEGKSPVPVEVWRAGKLPGALDPGKLGVAFDPRPAAVAIQDQRRMNQVLTAARSGSEHFERLPGTRSEVEALAQIFQSAHRSVRVLTDRQASEPALDRLATSGDLGRFAFIHLATHGLIDEAVPQRSAVILTQTELPDPLDQVLKHQPVYDGRLAMREIQRAWELNAELVTLSACETARGQYAGGEGFVGFTQALLLSGAHSVCLSLWKVDDTATALLMRRFYANLLGTRPGLSQPLPKAEALEEAKRWLRELTEAEAAGLLAALPAADRGQKTTRLQAPRPKAAPEPRDRRPYAHPYYWAAFILVGDPG